MLCCCCCCGGGRVPSARSRHVVSVTQRLEPKKRPSDPGHLRARALLPAASGGFTVQPRQPRGVAVNGAAPSAHSTWVDSVGARVGVDVIASSTGGLFPSHHWGSSQQICAPHSLGHEPVAVYARSNRHCPSTAPRTSPGALGTQKLTRHLCVTVSLWQRPGFPWGGEPYDGHATPFMMGRINTTR